MELDGFEGFVLLKHLVEAREMPLRDIYEVMQKKFHDHRDFYVLASLITGGYVDVAANINGDEDFTKRKNKGLAVSLYCMTFGKGEFTYQGLPGTNSGDLMDEIFFATAKADLYFEEQKQKSHERIIGLTIAIFIAIFAGWVKSYFGH